MIALVKISIWEQIFPRARAQSKASRDVVPVFCILAMHHPRDSSVQLAQSLKTYFCRWLLQEGFVDNGTMSYAALGSSGAKYIWHSWMYFCCTCNDTAAVDHVINLCLPLYYSGETAVSTVGNQINLMIAASLSDVLFSSLKDT